MTPVTGLPLIADVAQYQGQYDKPPYRTYLDFKALKASGVSAVIIRSMYGSATDRLFTIHRDAARAAGLLVGYYTFPVATVNLPYQVNKYAALANLQPNDGILTATDWETSGCDTMSLALMEQWQVALSKKICRPVLTYTSRGMVGDIAPGATASILGQTPLWAAAYGAFAQVPLPPFWARSDCALWQFRGGGLTDWPLPPALQALWNKTRFDVSAFLLGDETALKLWWAEMSGTPVEKF